MSRSEAVNWSYVLKHAWRFQGGERWSRDMRSLEVFVAQSNASGFPRLFGLGLHLLGDAVFNHLSSPLLSRGMKGDHLGVDAHPLSLTGLAWKASSITNGFRWWLYKWGGHFARYNQ